MKLLFRKIQKRVTSIKSELDFESADLAKDKLKEYTNLSNDIKNAIEKVKMLLTILNQNMTHKRVKKQALKMHLKNLRKLI